MGIAKALRSGMDLATLLQVQAATGRVFPCADDRAQVFLAELFRAETQKCRLAVPGSTSTFATECDAALTAMLNAVVPKPLILLAVARQLQDAEAVLNRLVEEGTIG